MVMGLPPMVVVWVLHSPMLGILSREAELQTEAPEALRWCAIRLLIDMAAEERFRFCAVSGAAEEEEEEEEAPDWFRALGGTKK